MSEIFDRGTRFGELFDSLLKHETLRGITKEECVDYRRFEEEFARQSRPFICPVNPGGIEKLSILDRLTREYGDSVLRVRHGDYADPANYAPERRQLGEMTLKQYLQIVSAPQPYGIPPYAGNFTLPSDFLTSLGAEAPSYYPAEIYEPPTVWLGAAGCITPLHRDSTDNFAIHLLGTKRWTIFPPQDAPYLYMTSVKASKGGDFASSAVDLRCPDFKKFPLFLNAKAVTFEVSAGELLYLPMGWSHYVENLSTSLMVNHWLSVTPIGIAALGNP